MQKHVFIVLCDAVEGREKEFNDWYDNVHLSETLAVPGFVSAQRFKVAPTQLLKTPNQQYLVIYEVETDDLEQLRNDFFEHMAKTSGAVDTLDVNTFDAFVFTALDKPKLKGDA